MRSDATLRILWVQPSLGGRGESTNFHLPRLCLGDCVRSRRWERGNLGVPHDHVVPFADDRTTIQQLHPRQREPPARPLTLGSSAEEDDRRP